jgi:predicted N-acetyltransferase YhbS
MVSSHYQIRPATPEDSAAITALFNDNPDTGRIAIAAQYHRDPLHIATALAPKTVVGVAEDTTTGQLVGIGMVRPEEGFQVSGESTPTAVLNSLLVHPAHRRQGIAKALAQWRIEAARAKLDDPLLVAGVQEGNVGSMAVVQSWSKAIIGPIQSCLVTTVSKQPQTGSTVMVRWAEIPDLEEIATGLNHFYRDYTFFSPKTADSLARWLDRSPMDRPTRRYAVAVDRQGNILAGLGVTEQHQFMQMKVANMPLALRLLNKIVGIVPADGYLKQSAVTHFWFEAARPEAARVLWEQVRWLVNGDSTHLTFFYDPRGPFPNILRLPRWLPRASSMLAVSRPLAANAGLICSP